MRHSQVNIKHDVLQRLLDVASNDLTSETIGKDSCPLCSKQLSRLTYYSHLGQHQEQLALFTLPRHLLPNATEEEDASSNEEVAREHVQRSGDEDAAGKSGVALDSIADDTGCHDVSDEERSGQVATEDRSVDAMLDGEVSDDWSPHVDSDDSDFETDIPDAQDHEDVFPAPMSAYGESLAKQNVNNTNSDSLRAWNDMVEQQVQAAKRRPRARSVDRASIAQQRREKDSSALKSDESSSFRPQSVLPFQLEIGTTSSSRSSKLGASWQRDEARLSDTKKRRGPVIVEVKPDGVASKSNIASSNPPGSSKRVSFAPALEGVTRPLTSAEAWSCYHFQSHERQCKDCNNLDERQRLCVTGHALAQDVAEHMYRKDGITYSTRRDNDKLVQVELPHDYNKVPFLLARMERAVRSKDRTVPVVIYAPSHPVSSRQTVRKGKDQEDDQGAVVIEPEMTSGNRKSRTKYKSSRYKTVVLEGDASGTQLKDVSETPASAVRQARAKTKRGYLYEDVKRPRKEAYEVEIREPEREERRRDGERRKSDFWL